MKSRSSISRSGFQPNMNCETRKRTLQAVSVTLQCPQACRSTPLSRLRVPNSPVVFRYTQNPSAVVFGNHAVLLCVAWQDFRSACDN